MLTEESDKAVATAICETLNNLINFLGPGAIDTFITNLIETVKNTISRIPPDSVDLEDDEEMNMFDEDEESLYLFIEACAVVVSIARAYRSYFMEFFDIIEMLDKLYMNPSPNFSFRFEASGSIAEIIQFIGPNVNPKLEYIFDLVQRGLNDQYCFIRSNFAFLAGILCENCGSETFNYYNLILKGVSPLFQEDEEMKVRDNAVGCIARLIIANSNNFPFQEVLPTFFSCLPLVQDMDENIPTYTAIAKLLNEKKQEILPYIPQIIDLFSLLIGDKNIQQEVQETLINTLKFLYQSNPKETKSIVNKLSNKQKKKN